MDDLPHEEEIYFVTTDLHFLYIDVLQESDDVHAELRSQAIRGNSLIHKIFTFLKPG